MGFMRRKSLVTADMEENRARNRLTKPMTGKSPSPRSSMGKSSPKGSQSLSIRTSASSQLSLQEIARTMSRKESRTQVKEHLFESHEENKPLPPAKDVPKKLGVASLVMQFEAAASSQQSLSKTLVPSRTTTSLYTSNAMDLPQQRQNIHNAHSREQLKLLRHSVSNITKDSIENHIDPLAIPKRRESHYRPGEATRKPSAESQDTQTAAGVEQKTGMESERPFPPLRSKQHFECLHGQRTQSPPVQRIQTPSDFKAIGKLNFGSLHVVNGRSSPVLSELSKHLIAQQLRDVSSEYADSHYSKDLWEDADVGEDSGVDEPNEMDEPRTPTRASPEVDLRQFSTPIGHAVTPDLAAPRSPERPMQSPDRTSIMAQSYIKELRSSPFSNRSPTPSSTGSVIHHAGSEDPVILSETRADDIEERSMSLKSDQPSMESKPSDIGTVQTRDLVFTSALEFQAPHFEPPPSPQRAVSPESLKPNHIDKPFDKIDSGYNSGTSLHSVNVGEAKQEQQKPLRINTAQPKEEPSNEAPSLKSETHKKERSPGKLGRLFQFRPAMPKSQTSAPIVMTVSTMQPRALALESGSDEAIAPPTKPKTPKKTATQKQESSPKTTRKLQKEPPQSRSLSKPRGQSKTRAWSRNRESKEIVVQRLPSSESSLDVPAIPTSARESLQQRCEQVPELERTFKSQNHTGLHAQPSINNLALPVEDIRFPSPYPNSDEDLQSPQSEKRGRNRSKNRRPRSKSTRRRSFLDIFRSDKDASKRETEMSKAETQLSIADFGDVVTMLGANPYAIAQSKPRTLETPPRSRTQAEEPRDMSVEKARRRLSMTDMEASEFARTRSHSIGGHAEKHGRKQFLDDRKGIPGKYIRSSLIESDVPPMPPLPNQAELKRMSLRPGMSSPIAETPSRVQQPWEETFAPNRPVESSPMPMPPAHSPRPSFVDYDYEAEHAVEDEVELAPPPPPHSPTPIDLPQLTNRNLPRTNPTEIEQQSKSPWDAQVRAWKERRMSAGERLKSHRKSLELRGNDYSYEDAEFAVDDDGPFYPVIPPRHPGRNDHRYQEPGRWMSNDTDYDDYNHGFDIRRNQTWDESAHDPYRFDHRRSQYSGSSFQNRQQRHNTWDDAQQHFYEASPHRFSPRVDYGSRQSNHRSRASNDSRQSFYSHNNCPIDRPFDSSAQLAEDSDDEYGHRHQYYTPQTSPLRGRVRHRQEYDYSTPNGYERQYHFQSQDAYQPDCPHSNQYDHGYTQPSTEWFQSPELPHHQPPAPPSRQPSPIPSFQDLPASLQISRPSSRASVRSTTPAISALDELHLGADPTPPQLPEATQFSNGFDFGHEVHGNGVGSRTSNAYTIKRKELPTSYNLTMGHAPMVSGMR